MDRPIVVGIDGSAPADAALDWAADDAARRGRVLRIVTVHPPWAAELPVDSAEDDTALTELHEALLADRAARVRGRAPGLEVTTAHLTGAVVERLRTESESADELVLGSRGVGGFAGLTLGSVGLALAGHARSPVVLVRRAARGGTGEVVVGYDGSADAEAALDYAVEQAVARGARLRAVYAQRTPALGTLAPSYGPLLAEAIQDETAEIRQRLATWQDKQGGAEVIESIVPGHPVPVLADASRAADLVVVGSRGLGGFTAAVLGSTSHGVIHRAHCPVAVVRAAWGPS